MDYFKTLNFNKTDILPDGDNTVAAVAQNHIFDGKCWRYNGTIQPGIVDISSLASSFVSLCTSLGLTIEKVELTQLTDEYPQEPIHVSKPGPGDYAQIRIGYGSSDADQIWYTANDGVSMEPKLFSDGNIFWAFDDAEVVETARTKINSVTIVRMGVPMREANLLNETRMTVGIILHKNGSHASFDDLITAFADYII